MVALVVALVSAFLISMVMVGASVAFDVATGRREMTDPTQFDATAITAALFLANNLSLASLIPISFGVGWYFFRQRPGWLSSVAGAMRWGWLGRCALIITPLWLVNFAAQLLWGQQDGSLPDLAVNSDTWLLVVGILLTTPLQAAGEEYGFRGALNRIAASFFANQHAGLVVGAVVSSSVFMVAHAAADPWLNLNYFVFGMVACFLTWRTGGLEAAIAMHVINNLVGEAILPFSDVSLVFDREAGAAGPAILIDLAVMVLAAYLLTQQASRRGLATTSAPGESMAMALVASGEPVPTVQTIPTPPMPPPPMLPKPPLPQPAPPPEVPRPQAAAETWPPPPLINPRPWQADPPAQRTAPTATDWR